MRVEVYSDKLVFRRIHNAELILYYDDSDTIKFAFSLDDMEPIRGSLRLTESGFDLDVEKFSRPIDIVSLHLLLEDVFNGSDS